MISKICSNILVKQLFSHIYWFKKSWFIIKRWWISCSNISRVSIVHMLLISFKMPWTSWSVWIIIAIFNQIVHRHYNIKIISLINIFIVYVSYAFRKWSKIFKCNSSISITTCDCYIPCYKNICIWIITKILFNDFGFKFNGCTISISFTIVCVISIIDNIQFSCCKFWRFIISIT